MEANWKELKKEFFDTGYVVLDGWTTSSGVSGVSSPAL